MSDFKAKMHQIRFPLGYRPRPHWGRLQRSRSPDSLAAFKGLVLRGGKGKRGGGGKREGKGRRVGKGRVGRVAPPPPPPTGESVSASGFNV